MLTETIRNKILVSALVAKVPLNQQEILTDALASQPNILEVVQSFESPALMRMLRLKKTMASRGDSLQIEQNGIDIVYQNQILGHVKILYKSPLPGELQARLSIEGITDRFLDYLLKLHQIVVLDESDRHVKVFIPNQSAPNFEVLWESFFKNVAFSIYGNTKYQLPGLSQTFVLMLNSVPLSARGFSAIYVPIITREQSIILAAFYFAIFQNAQKNREIRKNSIKRLEEELISSNLPDKDRIRKEKELVKAKQDEEEKVIKITKEFKKRLLAIFQNYEKQLEDWKMIKELEDQSQDLNLPTAKRNKILERITKLKEKQSFSYEEVQKKIAIHKQYKIQLLELSHGDPIRFVEADFENNPEKFSSLSNHAKKFSREAVSQIGLKSDYFALCILEMYQLMEKDTFESLPRSVLTENSVSSIARLPGDENKDICYSCGSIINSKEKGWKAARLVFENPCQRRQSSSRDGQPGICLSCMAFAFASPLKVAEKSIILRLDTRKDSPASKQKIKEYIRMLTSKELNLSTGKYLVLPAESYREKDKKIYASEKLGKVQYALAKIAAIFPIEVLEDFRFSLFIQASEPIDLSSRHLLLIKGLMECYGQSIISGKEINSTLGEVLRYVQQDLPYMAEYTLAKVALNLNRISLEQLRELYWKAIQNDIIEQRETMDSNNQLPKRARLYRDVAALTGLAYAFASSLENTAKGMSRDDREREISKLIEKIDDPTAFSYYATLGVETSLQARLWCNVDNYFIYERTKELLEAIGQINREESDGKKTWLQLYADDITKVYVYFSEGHYAQERDWKELTYNAKLSLYTRFPELVRKLKSTGDS
jgi:hypothetical protein